MKSKGNGAVLINQIDTQQGDVGSLSRDNVMTVADCFHKILGTLKNNEDAMVQGGARADAENELKSEPKKVESVDMANKVQQYALMQIDNVSGSETRGEELVKACGGRWKHKARLVKPIGENTGSGLDNNVGKEGGKRKCEEETNMWWDQWDWPTTNNENFKLECPGFRDPWDVPFSQAYFEGEKTRAGVPYGNADDESSNGEKKISMWYDRGNLCGKSGIRGRLIVDVDN
ncbi:unnamed protein product [Prunus armeniaca]|uniref:Uncharacterized protein n=1 Tax=Prunus armeniaca TaxID=36596 RepID=A0A6J5VAW1_PRUAR|nr:unnamed protein product [Prunus armeniaca]